MMNQLRVSYHWLLSLGGRVFVDEAVMMSLFLTLCLQNFLRCQNNKTNYNLVCETLQFLDIMCGSTTGGLGLLGLYINESNVHLITQTLETLTEYCQGPCQENQVDPRDLQSPSDTEAAGLIVNMDVCVCVCVADVYSDSRVQRYRHHHSSDPE